jgi:antiviral helicase SKI2
MANEDVLNAILNPERGDPKYILQQLGLDGVPSKERLRAEIEDELLTPKKELLSQWLDEYQMYVTPKRMHFVLTEGSHWDQSLNIRDLFTLDTSPQPLKLSYQRVGIEGRVSGVIEVRISFIPSRSNTPQ